MTATIRHFEVWFEDHRNGQDEHRLVCDVDGTCHADALDYAVTWYGWTMTDTPVRELADVIRQRVGRSSKGPQGIEGRSWDDKREWSLMAFEHVHGVAVDANPYRRQLAGLTPR